LRHLLTLDGLVPNSLTIRCLVDLRGMEEHSPRERSLQGLNLFAKVRTLAKSA
jgi:hypothetical protein